MHQGSGWINLIATRCKNRISRSQALKLGGATILGASLAPLFSRRALAPVRSEYDRSEASGVQYVPGSTLRMCQITGDYDPEGLTHINCTGQWGIEGTDLGVSVEHQGNLLSSLAMYPRPMMPIRSPERPTSIRSRTDSSCTPSCRAAPVLVFIPSTSKVCQTKATLVLTRRRPELLVTVIGCMFL